MRIRAWSLLAGVSLLLILAPTTWAASTSSAVITNGVLALGVSADGGLSEGTTGIQFVANGAEAMSPNCTCAPMLKIGSDPLTTSPESFFYGGTSAASSVLIQDTATGASLRMIEQFQPSASAPNLYEVVVTVQNLGNAVVDPTYTRPLAWANTPGSQFQLDLGQIAPGGSVVFREYFGAG
ncbi:MAG: hypothetical protein JOZ65_03185, partial [Chloroflexi bacterium]|nr:hypothetical protein [Chloroflexota bacterium]